jgi:aminoglycoside 3-N-acetyltransferase
MPSWLPRRLNRELKGRLKSLRLSILQTAQPLSRAGLLEGLRRVGVETSDTLLVHSSFDSFEGFRGKAVDILQVLQEAVEPSGTLLMPTLPFTGSAVEYVSKQPCFDVRTTPSRMGLLSELFRRSPEVIRSVHPTHAVAAWGASAPALIANHYEAATPCGRQTPYGRLLDHGGKILFLGTDISVMTFFHAVEEILEPRMPFSPFTQEVFSLQSRDMDGRLFTTRTRLFDPYYSRQRNLEKLVPVLRQIGRWNQKRVARLNLILLRAQDVLQAAEILAGRGIFCYGE